MSSSSHLRSINVLAMPSDVADRGVQTMSDDDIACGSDAYRGGDNDRCGGEEGGDESEWTHFPSIK